MRLLLSLSLVSALALTGLPARAQEQGTPTVPPAAPTAAAPAAPAAPATPPAVSGAAPANSWLEGPIPPEVGKLVPAPSIPALRNLIQQGTEIRYLGDEYGVKAYLMTNNGQGQVVYATPDNQAVLVGTLFSADASAVTFMQLLRLRRTGFDPTPFFAGTAGGSTPGASGSATAQNESPGERLLREANNSSWIAFGQQAAPQVIAFMDPNCDHCHDFFKMLEPYTAQNKIYLRVIPVSLVKPIESRQDVFNVLGAANPAAAWSSLVKGEMLAAVSKPDDKVILALDGNNKLFTDWQLKVTPYSVYRSANGGEVKVLAATPKDFKAFLQDLGVPPLN
jgi:thiol:disulfide interchange protein DsbG